jgi:hypothetical protein
MRQGEIRIFSFEIIVEKNVDVDDPRPPTESGGSTQIRFQLLEPGEEFGGGKPRLGEGAKIGEIFLLGVAPRRGAPKRRTCGDPRDVTCLDLSQCAAYLRGGITDIAAESEADRSWGDRIRR